MRTVRLTKQVFSSFSAYSSGASAEPAKGLMSNNTNMGAGYNNLSVDMTKDLPNNYKESLFATGENANMYLKVAALGNFSPRDEIAFDGINVQSNHTNPKVMSEFKGLFGFGREEPKKEQKMDQDNQEEEQENVEKEEEEEEEEEEENSDNDDDGDDGGVLMPVIEWIGGIVPKLAQNLS